MPHCTVFGRLKVIASGYRPHINEVLGGFDGRPDPYSVDETAIATAQSPYLGQSLDPVCIPSPNGQAGGCGWRLQSQEYPGGPDAKKCRWRVAVESASQPRPL